MKIIDISPMLSARTVVWPGDVPFSRQVCLNTDSGDHMTLSSITSTVHLGAHADAPNHYQAGGSGIAARDLELYYGPCQVVPVVVERGVRIRPSDLTTAITAPRILLHTGSFPDPQHWNSDFNALSAELIDFLHSKGVVLVGIDTPSIDLPEDKLLQSHQAVARHDMAILEGIVLTHVKAGTYTLCALPLRLENADASPVRAVLIAE
jgi:arylformamidase